MSEQNNHGYDITRRWSPDTEESLQEAKKAAREKTKSLLTSWRLNFNLAGDDQPYGDYPDTSQGHVKIQSASANQVHVEVHSESGVSVYDFNDELDQINVLQLDRDGKELPNNLDYLDAHDRLARVIFDCDTQETRGR